MVLFDLEKMKGKTLVQLADYATMRGLARTRPRGRRRRRARAGDGHDPRTVRTPQPNRPRK